MSKEEFNSLDTNKLLSGKDGRLYVTVDGESEFLAEVDTFQVQMTVNSTDYQPVGSILSYAVPLGSSFTLTFTEAVVRDNLLLEPILRQMEDDRIIPVFDFSGALVRKVNGEVQEQKVSFDNCVPDGSFDIMNLTPGEVIKRQLSFRVNSIPKFVENNYFSDKE
jgi:hypothetical protein